MQGCFAERIGVLMALSAVEQAALVRLEERERPLRRGMVLVRENDPSHELFILKSGLLMSYLLLDDGSRQIVRFLFPGDLVGASALVYESCPETIAALRDAVVCPFDRSAVTALVTDYPRLAGALIALCQVDRTALTDRLAALGRTSAKARIGALLLEFHDRLPCPGAIDKAFVLPLTQEEIGDATGLTAVHVNRMLRQLEEDGLIARINGTIRLLDPQTLIRSANYIDRTAGLSLGWLPASL